MGYSERYSVEWVRNFPKHMKIYKKKSTLFRESTYVCNISSEVKMVEKQKEGWNVKLGKMIYVAQYLQIQPQQRNWFAERNSDYSDTGK